VTAVRIAPCAATRIGAGTLSLLVVVAMLLGGSPAVARASDAVFGSPTATATYGESIEFRIPVTLESAARRVELQLTFPGSLGPFVVEVPPPPGAGRHELVHRWDLRGDGHLVPNTRLAARWVVTVGETEMVADGGRVVYADTDLDWRTVEGELIRVHWHQGDEAFGRRALQIGEDAVRETEALLGVRETDPIDFFIYSDPAAFRNALGPGTRENVGGQAHASIRTLFALITPREIDDPWVSIVVPHELVHLVFDTAVDNPFRFPPRWLNEGLAVYLSEGYGPGDRQRVERAASSGYLIPLDALTAQFPTNAERTFLAYAESVSAVDFLVRRHGRDAMIQVVVGYRDGLTDDEAFALATGEDFAAFQAAWLEDLGVDAPVRHGPQPAPAGPLPDGWSAGDPPTPPGPGPTAVPVPGTVNPDGQGGPAGVPWAVAGLVIVVLAVAGTWGIRRAKRSRHP
jgi:hypothetical protein